MFLKIHNAKENGSINTRCVLGHVRFQLRQPSGCLLLLGSRIARKVYKHTWWLPFDSIVDPIS